MRKSRASHEQSSPGALRGPR